LLVDKVLVNSAVIKRRRCLTLDSTHDKKFSRPQWSDHFVIWITLN